MIESVRDGNEMSEPTPELRTHCREVEEIVDGDEGEMVAEHEELRFLLGEAIERSRTAVETWLGLPLPEDAQEFVDAYLTAPEDSSSRQSLIAGLPQERNTLALRRLLNRMEHLVTVA